MKDLTKGNIYKTFFLFGLPLVLSGVLTQAYSIVNSVIAGRFLGETGLAATGATAPLDTFIESVFWGFCAGFAVYIAKLFTAKENGKLKASFRTCYALFAVLLVAIQLLLIVFYSPLERLLKIDTTLRKDAFVYFALLRIAKIFSLLNYLTICALNAMGVSNYTFFMSLLSSALSIVGNIVTVTSLHWGVAGIAIASAFSCITVFFGYLFKLKKCFKALSSEEKAKPRLSLMTPALPYILPNAFQQASMYLVGFLISPLVNGMGVEATASYAVVMRIFNLIATVYQNSSKSVSNYVAQCVGAKELDKIKKSVFVGFLQNILFALPFLLTALLFYKPVCGLFFKADASALTKQYTYDFVRRYLPFIFFNIVCNLFHGFYRGAKANTHLFLMTLFASTVQYLCALSLIPSMGMYGFYSAWVISWIAEAVVNIFLFFLGKWMPKVQP